MILKEPTIDSKDMALFVAAMAREGRHPRAGMSPYSDRQRDEIRDGRGLYLVEEKRMTPHEVSVSWGLHL